MTHLPFVAAAYAIGILAPSGLAVASALRLGRARARLQRLDPRAARVARQRAARRVARHDAGGAA